MTATLLLLAVGLAWGAPVPLLGLAAATVFAPWVVLPAMVVAAAVLGRRKPVRTSVAVEIAAQLRSGHTLRRAVTIAAAGAGLEGVRRLALAGMPMDRVADELAGSGAETQMVAAAVRMADRSGGRSAAVFDALGLAALDAEALRRERVAAAAPALLAAGIVGGLPLIYVGFLVVSGRLAALVAAGGPVAVFTVSGLGLVTLGVAAVAVQARGVRR